MSGSLEDARREWQAALGGQRLHHAWLLAGPRGSGKTAFALAAASELVNVAQGAQPQHHPDIVHLRREAKDAAEARKAEEGRSFELTRNITVAQIRGMQQRLTTRPTVGERRAIIIDPADDLEPSASNALLKSLEEPAVGTTFLLIAHQPARLLPTIRSRCRLLRFAASGGGRSDLMGQRPQLCAAIDALMQGSGDKSALLERFILAFGNRPSRPELQAALNLAQARLATRLDIADVGRFASIDATYGELRRLDGELATYNYDPDLLVARIGTLLSGVAAPIDAHDG